MLDEILAKLKYGEERNMTHLEEVEVVKKALILEKEVADLKLKITNITSETFSTMREKPTFVFNNEPYPDAVSDLKFNKWFFLLIIWPIVGWILLWYLYRDYKKNVEKHVQKIKESQEYKDKCKAVDEENARNHAIATGKYEEEIHLYEVELAEYNKRKQEWENDKNRRLEDAKAMLSSKERDAENFYLSTRLIPLKYHSVFALENIYNIIAYSEYSFKESAADYEMFLDRRIKEAQLAVERELLQTNKALDGRLNDIDCSLDKFANDFSNYSKAMVTAKVTNIIQTHNANKTAKAANQLAKEKFEYFKSRM